MNNTNESWEEVNPQNIPTWNYTDKETGEFSLKLNDEIIGTYENLQEDVGPNESHLYTIRQDNGDMIKIWGSTLLDARFSLITIGERVKIVYLGQARGKSGRRYRDYKVFHTHAKHKENVLNTEDIPVLEED